MTAVGASLEVINAALVYLGEQPMISDTDDVPAADIVRSQWAFVRRAELSAHPWQFATKRVQLGASGDVPAFGWARSFPLPADYLRLLELPDLSISWVYPMGAEPQALEGAPVYEIEGNAILSNAAAPLRCRYVADRPEWSGWHPLFAEAMAYRFASILAEAITQSSTRRREALEEYDRTIHRARRVNAIQKPPRRLPDASPWLLARHGGYSPGL